MGHTVLITGTSSGLGRASAEYFAEMGWNVVATMRNPKKEDDLYGSPNVLVTELDVTRPETIRSAMEEAIAKFGRIEVVINNAGAGMYGALELTSEADIDRQYAVNVKGPIDVIRTFLPHFREQGGGKFINISSIMGRSTALPLGSLYNMSKFALEGLTEGLYFELKPLNIDLHLVEPGGFESNFGQNVTFSQSDTITDYDRITSKVEAVLKASQQPGATATPIPIVHTLFDLATGRKKEFRVLVGKDAKTIWFLRKMLPIKTFLAILGKRFS